MRVFEGGKRHFILSKKAYGTTAIPIEFQPLGICSQRLKGGNSCVVAVADYFSPAVNFMTVTCSKKEIILSWESVISPVPFPADFGLNPSNRTQAVLLEGDRGGNLLVTRNEDNEFFTLAHPKRSSEWVLIKRERASEGGMIHSACRYGETLFTIESDASIENWTRRTYGLDLHLIESEPIHPFHYGIEVIDGAIYTITDLSAGEDIGVHREGKCILAGVYGNGICLLPDGSLLATRYTYEMERDPNKGYLIHIPAELLR